MHVFVMLRYMTALSRDRVEEGTKDPEIIRSLASIAFGVPFCNTLYDSVTNSIPIRDVNGSAFASISLRTGNVTLCDPSDEEKSNRFTEMYKRNFLFFRMC